METTLVQLNSEDNLKTTPKPKIREQVIAKVRYLYEDYPYWDRNKQQTRHKRFYIGHYTSDNIFEFSSKYIFRRDLTHQNNIKIGDNICYTHKFVGSTYLLDTIASKIGIFDDLKSIFPDKYLQILSLSYFLTLENENPLYRFSKWAKTHNHPYNQDIPSQRISELLCTITENSKIEFFKKQINRRLENEYFAYDTTSISSYSELIKLVKYGHNKDNDQLPQINLALIVGEKSLLPVYYRLIPGNINDSKTISKFIIDTQIFSKENLKFVMDRGFFSRNNIEELHTNGYKFLIGVKNNSSLVAKYITDLYGKINSFENFICDYNVYGITKTSFFKYLHTNDGKIDLKNKKFKLYIHIFYDALKAEQEKHKFLNNLTKTIERFKNNTATVADKHLITQFCTYEPIDNKNFALTLNNQIINTHCQSFGFFSLLSNNINDPKEALSIYRNKDSVEKSFENLKNRLNLRRTSVHSFESLEGLLFIQFIGLIFTSYINYIMKTNDLYKNYSMETLLDELDIISAYKYQNNETHFSEITSKQKEIFKFFDIDEIKIN
jgi:transposase